jgi:hypothetical protein
MFYVLGFVNIFLINIRKIRSPQSTVLPEIRHTIGSDFKNKTYPL